MRIRTPGIALALLGSTLVLPGLASAQVVETTGRFCGADNAAFAGTTTAPVAVQTDEEAKQQGLREPAGLAPAMPGTAQTGTFPGTNLPVAQTTEDAKQEGLQDFAAVRGMVLHGEGNLILVRLPETPVAGTTTTPARPGASMAVVRLPDSCSLTDFPDGATVMAVGEASRDGIFEATTVGIQPTL